MASSRKHSKGSRRTIVLLGAGRMGTALLKGWIAHKLGPIAIVEPKPSPELRRIARSNRIALHSDIEDADPAQVGVCVIAIKPQILRSEAQRLKGLAEAGALLVSIAAGTSTKTILRACGPKARVIRAMPNLPGAVGKGISALYAAPGSKPRDRAVAQSLLAALGEVVWVDDESMIDTVTAVSGSGPAYVFLLAEALAHAAEAENLSPPLAARLARATIVGAGALLEQSRQSAAALRRDVTSPGGTTEAALAVLTKRDALEVLIKRAVASARRRAQALND